MSRKVDKVNDSVDTINRSRESDSPDSEALFELLHEVIHRFKAALQSAMAEDESGLAVMEARALGFVARHDGATANDLVKRSGRDKGQVARLIGELVERGLLRREESTRDRRLQTLHATTEGKAVHRRLDKKRARAAATMFEAFSPAERATLAQLLRKLGDH